MISWVFETSTKNLSTKDVTWNSTNYSGDIITKSFSGITMRWNMGGNGLISPNEMTFEVSNTGGAYSSSDFQDEECIVRLIVDDVQKRVWKFKIERALDYYGKIKCWCVDFLKDKLKGDYPKTKNPKEVWSSGDTDVTDDYTIPVILGTAYIPVRSVNTGTERFYVLGESGPTYTIHEVSSPREWPNRSIWSAASYDMDGYVNSGYQLLQPIIADSDGDTVADAPGLWRSGDMFYDMLCRMERSDTSAYDNPSEWIEYVLKDFGVASGDIGSTSFAAAATLYDTLTVGFDGGGWWKKEPRERVLSNLLYQVDSYLVLTDQIDLYQFSADSVETISKALLLSFNPTKVTKSINDSGRVQWPEAYDKPSDILNGKAVVPTHDSGTELNPSSEILDCRFLSGQSINAQKAGILHFQKKFEQSQRVNFAVSFSRLTNQTTLCPGKVVTVDNTLYGGTNKVVITDMTFLPSGRVNFTGVILNYLEDWGDLTTSTKSVVTDTSDGFELATTDYVGNVSSDWDLLLNIPQRFLDTASLGINVTDSYMGYYDGSNFKVFIDSNGNMQCGDPNTGQGFVWNQSTGAFTISGSLTIQNPSGVRSDLNVADGATAGADWNTNITNKPDLGDLAFEDLVEYAKLGSTIIVGGYISSSLITADNIVTGTLTGRTVQTSSSGRRGVLSGTANNLKFYNASNQTIAELGDPGVTYDSSVLNINVNAATNTSYRGILIRNSYRGLMMLNTFIGLDIESDYTGITADVVANYSSAAYGLYLYCSNAGAGDGVGVSVNWADVGVQVAAADTGGLFSTTAASSKGCIGSGKGYDFYASGTGTNYGPFTGAHDGLLLKTEDVVPGDILIDVSIVAKSSLSNTIGTHVKSNAPFQTEVYGVFVMREGIEHKNKKKGKEIPKPLKQAITDSDSNQKLIEALETAAFIPVALSIDINSTKDIEEEKIKYLDLIDNYDIVYINAVGEGCINVVSEGGDIQIGDFICSSSTPGKGMKQTKDGQPDSVLRNYTVAKARENVVWTEAEKQQNAEKQIACTYHCG